MCLYNFNSSVKFIFALTFTGKICAVSFFQKINIYIYITYLTLIKILSHFAKCKPLNCTLTAIKLNRANALLSIIRNYVNKHILKTTYFAILGSHMNYPNLIYVEPKPTCIE